MFGNDSLDASGPEGALTGYPSKVRRETFPSGRLSVEDGLELTLATLPSAGVLPEVPASRWSVFCVPWLCWSEVYFRLGLSASAPFVRYPESLGWGHGGSWKSEVGFPNLWCASAA